MALVLVVDKDQAIYSVIQAVLTKHGHEVLIATTADAALELLGSRGPQLIFLDLGLPTGAGVRLLEAVRALDPRAHVVALTGALAVDLEEAARQLGVTDFVSKAATGRAHSRARGEVSHETAAVVPGPMKRDAIVVVDDEPVIVRLLAEFLTLEGYAVGTAENGAAALTLVERTHPDLILLDLYMPVMNGVELLRHLRARGYRGTVIVLTGSRDQELLRQALDLGSVDVLGKPVDLERLALVVEVALALSRGSR
jgi:CheY-like chemotaxis protein